MGHLYHGYVSHNQRVDLFRSTKFWSQKKNRRWEAHVPPSPRAPLSSKPRDARATGLAPTIPGCYPSSGWCWMVVRWVPMVCFHSDPSHDPSPCGTYVELEETSGKKCGTCVASGVKPTRYEAKQQKSGLTPGFNRPRSLRCIFEFTVIPKIRMPKSKT